MNTKLFDSHAHYYDARFSDEHNGGAEDILSAVFEGDVGWIVNVGTNNENSVACVNQAAKYKSMYAAVGIHPTDCQAYNNADIETEKLRIILAGRKEKKIVAIGEIGLDYHYEDTDKPKQKDFFRRQMALAGELGLPVIIHDRDAHGDCMEIIREFPEVRGILHSYSGSAETAAELIKLGWYISFSGVITFKNAVRIKEVAASVPLDRLLSETDCPYLAPHPHRGELNHSGLMHYTVEELAVLHGVTADYAGRIMAENAAIVFGIDLDK